MPPATLIRASRFALATIPFPLPMVVLAVLLGAAPAHAAIVLNEFMASNSTTIPDDAGDYDDWIEILNTGPGTVNLAGMFLTDNLLVPTRWQIPTVVLAAGQRILFWADAETAEGPLHTNFRLAEAGEEIGLFDTIANGNGPIDTVVFGEQATDRSYGRFPDGTGAWIYMATPTPWTANVNQGNIPPLVTATDHEPNSPDPGQPVTVTTRMRDLDGTLVATELLYSTGSGFVTVTLYDDGLHGDGAPGDQVYGAAVPGLPLGTTVRYYVSARDDDQDVTRDPAGAPGTTYAYIVGFTAPPLFLNEFMAANTSTIQDEWGEYDDWVEIYNAGPQPVDLTGMNLSDDLAVPNKYTFPPTILGPRDFLLVWCDGTPAQGVYHAGFRLAAAGEQLGLFAPAAAGYAVIDSLTFGLQTADVSLGREPDGGPVWRSFTRPTPRASNMLPIAVEEEPAPGPTGLSLAAPQPNPYSAETLVHFVLPRAGEVRLLLYDVQGRRVAVVAERVFPAGMHALRLNAAGTENGRAADGPVISAGHLAAGVYFLELQALGERRVRKLHVLP